MNCIEGVKHRNSQTHFTIRVQIFKTQGRKHSINIFVMNLKYKLACILLEYNAPNFRLKQRCRCNSTEAHLTEVP